MIFRKLLYCACTAALALPSVLHAAAADPARVRIDQLTVAPPDAEVCNFHTTDHINEPDNGTVLWFIESAANKLGRLDLASGAIEKFDIPAPANPVDYMTSSINGLGTDADKGPCDLFLDHEGRLWFNHQKANSIGVMDPKGANAITLVPMKTPQSLPMAMQLGGDGNIYVELTAANKIARVDPETRKVTEFAVPVPNSGVIGGAVSRDRKSHWFILMNANKLLRFDYASGAMKSFDIPTPDAAPFVIRAYDDGLWFSMFRGNAIGHFDPATEKFTSIPMTSANSGPIGIIRGRDNFLYTDLAMADRIARIDPETKTVVQEFTMPSAGNFIDEIKQGPDGAIWVPGYKSGKIMRLWLDSFGTDPGFPQKAEPKP